MIATRLKMASPKKKNIIPVPPYVENIIKEVLALRKDLASIQNQLMALEDKVDKNYLEQNPPDISRNFKATL